MVSNEHQDHIKTAIPQQKPRVSVVLTSLTTLVGFGSIALSHYPGLRSIGYVAIIGISACLFSSLILLPPLFAIIRRSGPKTPTNSL